MRKVVLYKSNERLWTGLCFVLFFCFSLSPVYGRASDMKGRLRGQVIDEVTQNPLVAAAVILEGTTKGTAVDMDGHYIIENIAPGIYNVRFMMMGYKERVVNNVVINPNRTTWQKIEMKPIVIQSEKVSVTAGYFHEARDGVVSNRSVDYQELRSDPGSAEDIQRVVQTLPSVVSGADQDNEIIVRGGMPGENLFVMDNIEIPNPNHFAEQGYGGGPINMINTDFVRRVDFYAGAFPARFGDKCSSVMDISLREGDREHMTGHASLGMAGAGLMAEGPLDSGRGSYIFSARTSYLDLIADAIGLTAIPTYYNLQGKVVLDINRNNQLLFNGLYGDDKIALDEGEDDMGNEDYLFDIKSGQYALGTTLRTLYGDKGFSRLTLSQVSNHWDENITRLSKQPVWNNRSEETETTFKSEMVYLPVKQLELNFGAQLKRIHFNLRKFGERDTIYYHEFDENGEAHAVDIFQTYDAFSVNNQKNTYKAAAFGQIKWNPGTFLTATLGLRADYFEYINETAIDPRLGFSFGLTPKTHLNLAVGRHSQAPNYSEITAHPMNSDLKYKETRQAVLGLDHLFREDILMTFEVFYKDYQKVPVGVADLTADPFDVSDGRGVSQGTGYSKGFELFLQKKLTGQYHFSVSYAYSIARGKDPRDGAYFDWDYDYRHMLTAMGGLHFDLKDKSWYRKMKKNWLYKTLGWLLPLSDEVELSCRLRYLGGRPYTMPVYHPELQIWILDGDVPLNDHRYPYYLRLDLRIDQRYMFDGWNIVAYLDMMNVLDRRNIWMYWYDSDGTVNSVDQFHFVPIGGITFEF